MSAPRAAGGLSLALASADALRLDAAARAAQPRLGRRGPSADGAAAARIVEAAAAAPGDDPAPIPGQNLTQQDRLAGQARSLRRPPGACAPEPPGKAGRADPRPRLRPALPPQGSRRPEDAR